MILLLIGILIGFVLGAALHERIVREDLKIAEMVKRLVGAKIAAIKAEQTKAVDPTLAK